MDTNVTMQKKAPLPQGLDQAPARQGGGHPLEPGHDREHVARLRQMRPDLAAQDEGGRQADEGLLEMPEGVQLLVQGP